MRWMLDSAFRYCNPACFPGFTLASVDFVARKCFFVRRTYHHSAILQQSHHGGLKSYLLPAVIAAGTQVAHRRPCNHTQGTNNGSSDNIKLKQLAAQLALEGASSIIHEQILLSNNVPSSSSTSPTCSNYTLHKNQDL